MAAFVRITAFSPTAFARHAYQIADDALGDGADYGGHANLRKKRDRRRRKVELDLEQAIAKAFDESRPAPIDRTPWLAEPVLPPSVIDVPQFNPVLAGLQGEVARLQSEIASAKFIAAQEEADTELLLLSL